MPFVGNATISYVSNGKVIGLSKLNRIVSYFASRPQIQERMTKQIAASLQYVLGTKDVYVKLEAAHHCIGARGVRLSGSITETVERSGAFELDGSYIAKL